MKKNLFALVASLIFVFVMSVIAYAVPGVVTVGDSIAQNYVIDVSEAEFYEEAAASELGSYMPGGSTEAELFGESIYDCLADGMRRMESKIDISSFGLSKSNINVLSDYYGNTLLMNPDLYYVSFYYTYWYNSKGTLTAVSPQYLVTDETEISTTQSAIYSAIDEIASCADSSMNDIEKLLTIYDRIIMTSCYDSEQEKVTAKDLLLDGETVCQGYASVLYAVATELGIPCGFVRSKDMNHVWNAVCVDNTWYHVDITWDDFSYADSLRVTHEYFLKSNDWMESEGDHYGFTFIEDNCDKYDDYFWNDAVSQIIILDNNMYYVDGAGTYGSVCCFDTITETVSKIYCYDSLWPIAASRYYLGAYSGLALYDNRLYFNTHNEILSCNLDGTDIVSELLYEDTTNNSIYGCCIEGSKLHYVIGEKSSPYNITQKLLIVLYEVEEPDYTNVLVTRQDIGMRVNDVTGMRFKATIEKEPDVSAFGWIVTREALLKEAGIDPSAFTLYSPVKKVTGFNYGYGVETAKIFESNDDYDCFTAIIYFSEAEEDGYPSVQKLSEKIVARPFAVIDGVTIYGDTTEPVSVYDVALDIYNDADIYDALSEEVKLYISGVINKVGLLNLDS